MLLTPLKLKLHKGGGSLWKGDLCQSGWSTACVYDVGGWFWRRKGGGGCIQEKMRKDSDSCWGKSANICLIFGKVKVKKKIIRWCNLHDTLMLSCVGGNQPDIRTMTETFSFVTTSHNRNANLYSTEHQYKTSTKQIIFILLWTDFSSDQAL